jgi:hypothetical protein
MLQPNNDCQTGTLPRLKKNGSALGECKGHGSSIGLAEASAVRYLATALTKHRGQQYFFVAWLGNYRYEANLMTDIRHEHGQPLVHDT